MVVCEQTHRSELKSVPLHFSQTLYIYYCIYITCIVILKLVKKWSEVKLIYRQHTLKREAEPLQLLTNKDHKVLRRAPSWETAARKYREALGRFCPKRVTGYYRVEHPDGLGRVPESKKVQCPGRCAPPRNCDKACLTKGHPRAYVHSLPSGCLGASVNAHFFFFTWPQDVEWKSSVVV